MITVTLCVFLLSYMYGEGKSNYFKGSILLLSYLVVIMGFFLSDKASLSAFNGGSRFDPPTSLPHFNPPSLQPPFLRSSMSGATTTTFKTIGRGSTHGQAW